MSRNTESNPPIKKFRSGVIEVAVWKKDGERGAFFSATPQRAFKREGAEKWEHTTSFNRDDLPVIAKLMNDAHSFICKCEEKLAEIRRAERGAGAAEEDDVPMS